ncbi:hypothetical protein Tco_0017763 [Tanacetum coccineum]
MVVQNQSKLGKGSANPTDPHHTPTIIKPSTQPQKTQKPRKPKRKDTQVPQPSDPSENVADEAVHKELLTVWWWSQVPKTMGDTTARTRFKSVSKHSNDSLLARGNTLQSDEDRLKLNELMALCTTLQNRVSDLEKTKTSQHNEIASLKWKVKKLEKRNRSRTHRLKRLYRVGLTARVESSGDEESLGEDASKQGRIDAIDADEEITLVSVQNVNEEMFDVNVLDGEEDVSIAGDATTVSAATTTTDDDGDITLAQVLIEMKSTKPNNKRVVIQELGEPTITISSQLSSQQSQDKGKAILIEPMKPMKKKDQIRRDEETALMLQAEFDEEERLAREKAKKEVEANIALIETWVDIQTKIDADHQLAERLQAQEQEELSIKEKATLFQQLLEKRKTHFAAKRAEEKRNKPPTKAQRRQIIAFKRVNTFEDFRTELVEGKKKSKNRADTRESKEAKAVKSPSIVRWKIYKEGRKTYYQIMRADEKSQTYMIISHMLKSFNREDLEDLYKLVKAKYESTRPVEYLDLLLWGDLKIMFEPHVEDKIYMLVEKKYPVAPLTLSMMLEKKLIIDYESEMAYQPFKFIIKQLKKIIGIKSLLDAVRIIDAHVCVNAAQLELVLLRDFKENMLNSYYC